MEEVDGDAAMDGAALCRLRTDCRQNREIELRRNAAISVEPFWWHRLGLNFILRIVDDAALPMVQMKTTLWEWRWRERRGERWGSSLEVEDGVAKPAG